MAELNRIDVVAGIGLCYLALLAVSARRRHRLRQYEERRIWREISQRYLS